MKPGVIRPPKPFYDGSPGRELVSCLDCGQPADALFGDHGGTCLRPFRSATRLEPPDHDAAVAAAVAIIRSAATHQFEVSANSCRAMMDAAGIAGTLRSAGFRAAVREGVIEYSGYTKSTEQSPHAHKHQVRTYRSLIWEPTAQPPRRHLGGVR